MTPFFVFNASDDQPTAGAAFQRYLLKQGRYLPNEYAGALIGSFDGFKSSFVIGRESSIIVPGGADTLSLAVNGKIGSYRLMTGKYEVNVIDQPGPGVPTRTTNIGDATFNTPQTVHPWEILSSVTFITYQQLPEIAPVRGIRSRTLQPIGSTHFSIYDSHVR